MDFYKQQDEARRNTRLLVILFMMAVALLIAITNVLIAVLLFGAGVIGLPFLDSHSISSVLAGFSWETFTFVSAGVVSTVLLVVLFKWIQLAAGGKAVAERLGGSRILPDTRDPAQRRCLNVIEEMALAAGLPVPPVYELAAERGINAFAAGISPADAVIGVTRGSLEKFNREQLQGVMAHEFSHILNGDMRLNIRLAALLKGITFLGDVGEVIFRGGRPRGGRHGGGRSSLKSSKRVPGQLLAVGLALWVMGWLGGLFAGFIKAAISRQREYLADASAVQFTRNPQGVANALKVIGAHIPGTVIVEARANELSHIFFGQIGSALWQVFATHPPLEDRIRRIEPGWNGEFIETSARPAYTGTEADRARRESEEKARAALATKTVAALVGAMAGSAAEDSLRNMLADAEFAEVGPDAVGIIEGTGFPAALYRQAHDPFAASACVLCLLMSADGAGREQQFRVLEGAGVRGQATTARQLLPDIDALSPDYRMPLLELCLPSLKCMSAPQYRNFKTTMLRLIQADRQIDLYEWCMYQVLRHYLDPEFVQVRPSRSRFRRAVQVGQEYCTVLSVLAWRGHDDAAERNRAFTRGVESVGLYNLRLRALEDCSVSEFGKAVAKLADCYPLLKPRLLKGMALCASHNDELTAQEREILVAVAAVMDCPAPAQVRLAIAEP